MAISNAAQLAASSSAVYTTNGANTITAALVRPFNNDFISSSVLIQQNNIGNFQITGTSTLHGISILSGSFGLTGSATTAPVTVGASATASIDCNAGNLFLVQLGANATTRFEFNNIRTGQSGNLVVTTPTSIVVTAASFSSNVKQPSGSAYIPTSGSNAIDVLSFVTDNNSTVFVVNTKKFI
jgi:hypothetical protein